MPPAADAGQYVNTAVNTARSSTGAVPSPCVALMSFSGPSILATWPHPGDEAGATPRSGPTATHLRVQPQGRATEDRHRTSVGVPAMANSMGPLNDVRASPAGMPCRRNTSASSPSPIGRPRHGWLGNSADQHVPLLGYLVIRRTGRPCSSRPSASGTPRPPYSASWLAARLRLSSSFGEEGRCRLVGGVPHARGRFW